MTNRATPKTAGEQQAAKFSAGPWSVTDPRDGHKYLCITSRSRTRDSEDVATVDVSRLDVHPNARGNARLIAQAPAMYALLKKLVTAHDVIAGGEVDALTVEAVHILAAIEGGR